MTPGARIEPTRDILINAAKQVLQEKGVGLSLDAVARQAGVSKGGLLHYFPGRKQLLVAVRNALIDDFHARLDAIQEEEVRRIGHVAPGAWLRAYIEISLLEDDGNQELFAALAPLLSNENEGAWHENPRGSLISLAENDGIPAGRAHAVRLACDAYWLSHSSGMPSFHADSRNALIEQLVAWTHPD